MQDKKTPPAAYGFGTIAILAVLAATVASLLLWAYQGQVPSPKEILSVILVMAMLLAVCAVSIAQDEENVPKEKSARIQLGLGILIGVLMLITVSLYAGWAMSPLKIMMASLLIPVGALALMDNLPEKTRRIKNVLMVALAATLIALLLFT